MQVVGAVSALIVNVGDRSCALPLSNVSEVMRPLPVQSIQLRSAASFVPGLCLIRGEAVPLVDLGALLGREGAPAWGRFVTVKAGNRIVALAVEGVTGVRKLEAAALRELPPLFEDAQLLGALGASDAKLLLVLRSAWLVPEQVWAELEATTR